MLIIKSYRCKPDKCYICKQNTWFFINSKKNVR